MVIAQILITFASHGSQNTDTYTQIHSGIVWKHLANYNKFGLMEVLCTKYIVSSAYAIMLQKVFFIICTEQNVFKNK